MVLAQRNRCSSPLEQNFLCIAQIILTYQIKLVGYDCCQVMVLARRNRCSSPLEQNFLCMAQIILTYQIKLVGYDCCQVMVPGEIVVQVRFSKIIFTWHCILAIWSNLLDKIIVNTYMLLVQTFFAWHFIFNLWNQTCWIWLQELWDYVACPEKSLFMYAWAKFSLHGSVISTFVIRPICLYRFLKLKLYVLLLIIDYKRARRSIISVPLFCDLCLPLCLF